MADAIKFEIRLENGKFIVNARDVKNALKDIGDTADDAGSKGKRGFGELKNGFSSINTLIKGFIGLQVVRFFYDMGKSALASSAAMDKHRIALSTMLGSAAKAQTLLGNIQKFAAETPFEMPGLIESAKQLIAFGVSSEDVIQKLTNLGNAAQGNQAILERIAYAYGKISARGRTSMEELNMIIEAGVPILDELATQSGVTKTELFKLIESGKIGFKDVDKAITNLTTGSGKFAGMLQIQSQSLGGLFSTLKDQVNMLALSFGDELSPSMKSLVTELILASNEGGVLSLTFHALAQAVSLVTNSITTLFVAFRKYQNMGKESAALDYLKRSEAALKNMEARYRETYGVGWEAILKNNTLHQAEYDALLKNRDAVAYYKTELTGFSSESKKIGEKLAGIWADQSNGIEKAKTAAADFRNNVAGASVVGDVSLNTNSLVSQRKSFEDKWQNVFAGYQKDEIEVIQENKKLTLDEMDRYYKKAEKSEVTYQTNRAAIEDDFDHRIVSARVRHMETMLSSTTGVLSQLSEAFQADTQLRLAEIDSQTNKKLEALEVEKVLALDRAGFVEETRLEELEREVADLEGRRVQVSDIKERESIDEALREKKKALLKERIITEFDKRKASVEETANKRKRKLEREEAKRQKAINIAETIISTAVAAMNAIKAFTVIPIVGPALGIAMAGVIAGLGAWRVSQIRQQPLPELARGGYVEKDTIARIGEGRYPEAVMPLNEKVFLSFGKGIAPYLMNSFSEPVTLNSGHPRALRSSHEQNTTPSVVNNVTNFNVSGDLIDAQKLLTTVDRMQEGVARDMGASKYTFRSAY